MRHALRSGCALLLAASLAHAQLLTPTGQDRSVDGFVEASDSGTTQSDSDHDEAPDFGPWSGSANAFLSFVGGIASGSGFLNSEIQPDAFVADGFSAVDAFGDWSWDVLGEARAEIDFVVTQKVRYSLTGFIEGYDDGYASWELRDAGGTYLDGEFGIAKGVITQNHSGILDPGAYRIHYFADCDTGSSSGGQAYGFAAFDLAFELEALAGSYCATAANSAGAGALLAMSGSQSIAANDFHVNATGGVPGEFGLVYYGSNQIQLPFGDGFRCVGGQAWRLNPPQMIDGNGAISRQVDFSAPPAGSGGGQILPDSTWNFQLWYRDPSGPGGAGFNLSDALWVTFCP